MKKTNKAEFIITFCVFVWVLIINILAVVFGITSWPMFFVTIFFFALHADPKNILSIFAGGTLGLFAAYALAAGLTALAPSVGLLGAFAILITVILGIIILGGTVCPAACNNIAFAYLTVATVMIHDITINSILNNLAVLYVGGAIILGGAIIASKIGEKIISKGAPAQ